MQPETVLAFDTSAAHCAAALLLPDGRVIRRAEEMSKGQAERLVPLLEELLSDAGLAWSDLTLIAVGIGPGNFTGVRISVATARGLALGLSIPAIGITTLEALAYGQVRPVLVAQDAKRGAAYVQMFHPKGSAALVVAPTLPESFAARAEPLVIGDLAATYAEAHGLAASDPKFPLIEAMARLAIEVKDARKGLRPAPFYMRPADAAPASDPPPVILDA